jgi:hypothetical protein
MTPCSDDCVRVLAFYGRLRNGSIDSPLEPQAAPSLHCKQLIQSANTNPVESNMRRNDDSKSKDPEKRKTRTTA